MPRPHRLNSPIAIGNFACATLLLALSGCQMMNGYASNNLGSSYYREGNYAAARRSFQQAVVDMPENPDFRHNLAATIQKQGDMAGAEQVYRQALQIDPSHQPTYHGMAQLLTEQGRSAEAGSMLQSWVATQPYSPTPLIEMAWLQQQQGNQTAAVETLQSALKLEPNNAFAMAQLGEVYQKSGQPELASAYYQRSLQGNWRQPEVQNRLAAMGGKAPIQNNPQIAFSGQMPLMSIAPSSQTAWQTTNPMFASQPSPIPVGMAAAPNGSMPQPTFANSAPQMPTMATQMPPQVQTAWMPPQAGIPNGQQAQPTPNPYMQPSPYMQGAPPIASAPMMAQQPTLAAAPTRPYTANPQPMFAAGPPQNADPAHIPQMQMTAELPVVRAY